MTETTRAALASIKPIEPGGEDGYFGPTGSPIVVPVTDKKTGKTYLVEEGLQDVAPVDEDYQRSFVVTDDPEAGEQPRQLAAFSLVQADPSSEGEAHAEVLIRDPEIAESPEVVGEVIGEVMKRFYLNEAVATEEDIASIPSGSEIDAGRFLARAGFQEGNEPGTFELRVAA